MHPVMLVGFLCVAGAGAVPGRLADGEGVVESAGVKIWYRVEGAPQKGLPLLIIHGGPGETAYPFERTIGPILARTRPVIYTDDRGVGRSQRIASASAYSLEQIADDEEAIRRKLGISAWAVFGHSNGAAIALRYATRHPESLRALILCDPLLSPRDLEVNMAQKVANARDAEQARALRAVFSSPKPLAERFGAIFGPLEPGWTHRMMFHAPENGARLDAMQSELKAKLKGQPLMAPEVMEGLSQHGFFSFDAFSDAAKLTAPVLVLDGSEDRELSLDNGVLFAATVPHGQLRIIEKAGHFPFIEETAATASAIDGFLSAQKNERRRQAEAPKP